MLCDLRKMLFLTLIILVFIMPLSDCQEYVAPVSLTPVTVEDAIKENPSRSVVTISDLVTKKDIYTATAYCLRGRTATGSRATGGTIGVDPRYIPLGSKLYITGYGFGVASDVGGVIKGKIIDVWLPSYSECTNWGRQTVTVYILKAGVSEQEFLLSLRAES